MNIKDQIILVTGANGGIGRALVNAFLAAGARKIYACARDIASLDILPVDDRISRLKLDICNTASIEKAAMAARDVTLLVNNAGTGGGRLLGSQQIARREMEVNYFGTHAMCTTFAPILSNNGGGCIVNVISVIGLVNMPSIGTYCASKAALHSLTQGMRGALSSQKTVVVGVYPGPVDTRMTDGLAMAKASPESVAEEILTGVAAGLEEIYPDSFAKKIHEGLLANPKEVAREMAKY
ncbi:MAG: short-chain dehydrogenase [Desulfovibrio sp. MES5]|uniref:SDR family oxidoreductase n=1 Tax=Desulfovibrio sp. MES5 TaxID=1899016 RepID=UPI000B9D206E|nr:SDR family oxidoreductase [Desulfovibrio sp. MES5]OXS27721.1 MAG: short-chain dehydrogenase [Desulfovibrio sp. MES5]